jgi:hypothetical protein
VNGSADRDGGVAVRGGTQDDTEGRSMRGRKPAGPDYVAQLPGSDQAKERVQVVLQTLTGTLRMEEACQRLGIGKTRFHQVRQDMLLAAVASQEPKPVGRPPRVDAAVPAVQVAALVERVAELEVSARLAQIREEIALLLPRLGLTAEAAEAPEKKPRRRPKTRRPSRRRT